MLEAARVRVQEAARGGRRRECGTVVREAARVRHGCVAKEGGGAGAYAARARTRRSGRAARVRQGCARGGAGAAR